MAVEHYDGEEHSHSCACCYVTFRCPFNCEKPTVTAVYCDGCTATQCALNPEAHRRAAGIKKPNDKKASGA